MKGYYIHVKNDLLEPKHCKAIGDSAIWEFLWLLDKMTSISEEGFGKVLGGRPINLIEFSEEVGHSTRTVSRNINRLKEKGYILITRAPYGVIIKVNKAKKVFGQRKDKIGVSKREDKFGKRYAKIGLSNKTLQYNTTNTTKTVNKEKLISKYKDEFKDLNLEDEWEKFEVYNRIKRKNKLKNIEWAWWNWLKKAREFKNDKQKQIVRAKNNFDFTEGSCNYIWREWQKKKPKTKEGKIIPFKEWVEKYY